MKPEERVLLAEACQLIHDAAAKIQEIVEEDDRDQHVRRSWRDVFLAHPKEATDEAVADRGEEAEIGVPEDVPAVPSSGSVGAAVEPVQPCDGCRSPRVWT
jgi:hypothetical protein